MARLDNDGDLSQVQSRKANGTFQNYANSFNYTAAGAVSSMRLGNGKWESTQFNSRLQPTQIALGASAGNTNLLKLDYSYGTTQNNGNVQSQTITVPTVGSNLGFVATQVYNYDSLNRLSQATETVPGQTGWNQTFIFDRYGNRNFNEAATTTLPKNCGTPPNQTVCPADVPIVNPSVNLTNNRLNGYLFDSAGNTTRDAESRKFTYDAENKQVEVRDASNNIVGQYVYDGDGKRVKKIVPNGETVIFVYDAAGKLIAEYSNQISQTPQVSYLTSDHLGSPRINTDQNGAVIARHDYMPFGEEIVGTGGRTAELGYTGDDVRKKFATYERDSETDLDFAQARYYAKKLGRFNSPDHLLKSGRIHIPQSWNRYNYVLGNPLKFNDPLGLFEYLEGTSDEEKERIGKGYKKLVEARDKFKEGSKKYKAIDKALKTLGAPGEKNGVTIFVANTQKTPGTTLGSPSYGGDGIATGKAEIFIGINLSKFTAGDNGTSALAGTLGHEGTHAADFQSESAKVAGMGMELVNARSAAGKVMSRALTEVHAYRVSSYVAEAISPSDIGSVGFSGSEVWNRAWAQTDMDANREKGIRGVLESPTGTYHFRYVPNSLSFPMPFLNNSLDRPKQWKTDGGPIF